MQTICSVIERAAQTQKQLEVKVSFDRMKGPSEFGIRKLQRRKEIRLMQKCYAQLRLQYCAVKEERHVRGKLLSDLTTRLEHRSLKSAFGRLRSVSHRPSANARALKLLRILANKEIKDRVNTQRKALKFFNIFKQIQKLRLTSHYDSLVDVVENLRYNPLSSNGELSSSGIYLTE